MFRSKRWVVVSLLGAMAVVGALVGVAVFGATGAVSAAEELRTMTGASTPPGLLSTGYLSHGGGWGLPGRGAGTIDYEQLLAEALGISVDDLQAAYETAREAAIAQAVDEGLITQERADEMLVWGGLGRRGFGILGHFGGRGPATGEIDEEALLADALGISVDQLQAAREEANEAALAQAVEEGLITQEQADEMLARRALQDYVDREVLLAEALGMEVEDVQAAYAEGKSLSDLMSEQGLDAATVRDNLQQAHEDALTQAVEDGVITQEQADAMQDGFGFGAMPMGRGRGGLRGPARGGFRAPGGFRGLPDDAETDDTETSMRFRVPSRGWLQGDSDL